MLFSFFVRLQGNVNKLIASTAKRDHKKFSQSSALYRYCAWEVMLFTTGYCLYYHSTYKPRSRLHCRDTTNTLKKTVTVSKTVLRCKSPKTLERKNQHNSAVLISKTFIFSF